MNEQIKQLAQIIDASSNIVFFGGAGVSTESGIPDFRSEKGIYETINHYGYPPEQILSRTFFYHQTAVFYDFYKQVMVYENAKPNAAHYALAKLEEAGKVKAVITQNIDGLHQMAGSKKVLELHGSIHRNRCMKCDQPHTLYYVMKSDGIPKCIKCGSTVKPEVVLYDEALEDNTVERAVKAIHDADVLIVGGTSLAVYPAAGLLQYYRGNKLILINKGETSYDQKAHLVIREKIGEVFQSIV